MAHPIAGASLWVGDRIAEQVEEEGLGEGVELGEGVAALGPQRLGLIQDRRNPSLLCQRREGNLNPSMSFGTDDCDDRLRRADRGFGW